MVTLPSVRTAALWSMASQYAAFVIQFAVTVIVSRYFLAPDEVGLYSIAVAATMLIAIFQDFGLTRYISGLAEIDERQIRTCMSVAILLGLAVVLAIFASIWPVSAYYDNPQLASVLAILALSYLLTPFHMIPTALMTRDLDFRGLFFVNVSASLASAIVAISLASLGFSASSLAWAMVAQASVRTIVAQRQRAVRIPLPLMLQDLRPILSFGSGSAVLTIIGAIGVRTPDLIIGSVVGMTAVGLFSRAAALAGQLYVLLSGAIGSIFYPTFARIRDRGEALGEPYTRVVAGYCAVTMPAMFGLCAAAVPLINTLFGPKWAGSAEVLQYIAISEIFFIALPLHMDLPILMGRMKSLIWYNLAESAASVSMLAVAAHWGLPWAAASRIAYGVVWYAIYARFMQSVIGFRWSALISIYAKSLISSLAAVTPLLLAYRFWIAPEHMGLPALALLSGIGVGLWTLVMMAVKHPAETEIRQLAQAALAPVLSRVRGAG